MEAAITFVPRWLARRLAAGEVVDLPRAWTASGATLFIDLVGFTALTDQYASAGPEGAEQLRSVLDAHFGGILEEVDAWGGDAAAFAGDAVLVAFFDSDYLGRTGALEAAIACARAVQARPPTGLKQRMSIGAGELTMWALAGEGERGIHVLGGAAVAQLQLPHSAAQPGEIVLSAAASGLVTLLGAKRAGGTFALMDELPRPRPGLRVPTPATLDALTLRAWLPRVIVERGNAGQAAWVDEFRTATICFVTLPVGSGGAIDPSVLQAEVSRRVDILAHFEGDCLGVVMDEKGATLIGAFGLPGRAHGDDAARAVRAVATMQAECPSSTGVATGRLFVGLLGAPQRRDYGGLGPTMNLAARLMGKADDGVLVDEITRRAAEPRVAFEALGTVRVKGVPEPIAVYAPCAEAVRGPVIAAAPMLGRAAERGDLLARMERGTLRSVVIGEPGIGKSSLLTSVMTEARARGVRVLYGEGGAIERFTPWHAWKAILSALVAGRSAEAVLSSLGDPDLAARASLLDGLWPLTVPTNAVVEQMESAARAAAIRAIVVQLLVSALAAPVRASLAPLHGGGRARVLLVLDDVHWLDTASVSVAREVLARVPGLNVLLGTRPLGAGAPPELTRLVDGEGLDRVALGAMSEPEVVELVGRTLGVALVPSGLGAFIYNRSGGHPFYSEQLALALRDAGVVTVEDHGTGAVCEFDGAGAVSTLPATVEGVVTARIDALAPGAQLTAKVASVIGRVFPEGSVQAIYPVQGEAAELPQWLGQLAAQELILPEAGTLWGFKHAITQEVAYNLLLFAQRRELHRRAAEYYGTTPDGQWPTLAWHWEHAGASAEALDALEHAAVDAFREHANTEGIAFLDRARALVANPDGVETAPDGPMGGGDGGAGGTTARKKPFLLRAQRARWLPALAGVSMDRLALWETLSGTARLKLAAYPQARDHFRRALDRLGTPVPATTLGVGLDLLVGCLQLTRRLIFGVRRPEDSDQRSRLRAAAEAHQGLAEVAYFSLDLPGLLHADVHAINAAERAGEPREIAIACASGAIGAGIGGLYRLGWRWNAQALAAARETGHLPTIAYVNLLSSVFTNTVGACTVAAGTNAEATALFLQLGDAFRASSSLCGEAFGAIAAGDVLAARRFVGRARVLAPREGALQVMVWCAVVDVLLALLAGEGVARAVADVEARLAQDPHHAERILALGALAGGRRALGDAAGALAPARDVVRLASVSPPTNWFALWPLAEAVETIRLAGQAGTATAAEVRAATKALRTFAGMCALAGPRADLAEAAGMREGAARRRRERALGRARELGLPWDVALCEVALRMPAGEAGIARLQEAARGAIGAGV